MGSSKHVLYNEITVEFIVNHINKTFDWVNDVSESLLMLVKLDTNVWNPTLEISSDIYASIKESEYTQFVRKYKAKLNKDMRRKITYEDNT